MAESSSDISLSSVLCDMIIMVCEAQVPAERVCWKDGNKCHLAVANGHGPGSGVEETPEEGRIDLYLLLMAL